MLKTNKRYDLTEIIRYNIKNVLHKKIAINEIICTY